MEGKKKRGIWLVSDFDGTLMDTYWALPKIYERLLGPEFVEKALELEDELDFQKIYDKKILFGKLLEKVDEDIVQKYWDLRVKFSRPIPGALEVIPRLKQKGMKFAILSSWDGVPRLKRKRIAASPFYNLADEIKIVGEDVRDRVSFLADLEKAVYVDDKVEPLLEVKRLKNVYPVRLLTGSWPLKKSRMGHFEPTVRDWFELEKLIFKILKRRLLST